MQNTLYENMYDKLYYIFPEKVTWTIRMSTHCQALFYGLPQNLLNTMVAISKKMSNLYVFVGSVVIMLFLHDDTVPVTVLI